MNKWTWILLINCIVQFVVLSGCSVNNTFSGGSINTGNPCGIIVTQSGTAVDNAKVTFIPATIRPDTVQSFSDTTRTDTDGFYRMYNLNPGTYNIECVTQSGDRVLIAGVFIDSSVHVIATDTVTPPGQIKGRIKSSNLSAVLVFLPGTPYYTTTDISGIYELENIPRGNYEMSVVYHDTLAETVATAVTSNDTTFSETINLSQPKSYVVSPDGNDTNDGSLSSPWAGIMYAVQQTGPGDTIYLRDGNYDNCEIDIKKNEGMGGAKNLYKVIMACPGETPLLKGVNHDYLNNEANYISFQNLHFELKYRIKNSADYVEIMNCTFTGVNPMYAVIEFSGSHGLVQGNYIEISDSGGNSGRDGMELYDGTNNIIRGNTILNAHTNGIYVYEVNSYVSDIIIDSNIVINTQANSGLIIGEQNRPTTIQNILVKNNVFAASNFMGLTVYGGSDISVYHNTFYANGRKGIYIRQKDSSTIADVHIVNNLFEQSPNSNCTINADWFPNDNHIHVRECTDEVFTNNNLFWPDTITSEGTKDTSAIFGEPLCVDPAQNNYHLQNGSPAIDNGIDLGWPYNGTAPDLGAFEYGSKLGL